MCVQSRFLVPGKYFKGIAGKKSRLAFDRDSIVSNNFRPGLVDRSGWFRLRCELSDFVKFTLGILVSQSMVSTVNDVLSRLRKNVESVVYGKAEVVQLVLTALLAGEHLLLEDVPGVGKTLL